MRLKFLLTLFVVVPTFCAESAPASAKERRQAYARRQSSSITQKNTRKKQTSQTKTTRTYPSSKRKPQVKKSEGKNPPQQNVQAVSYSLYSNESYSCCTPETWQCINDKTQLPEKLDVIFIGQGRGGLTPTINIAQELTNKTTAEYLDEVLTYHKSSDTTLESSIFTQIQAQNATFHLLKTEKSTSWGKVYCLQAIAIVHHTAYIITSTSTQDDYPDISVYFLKTVSSFKLSEKMEAQGDTVLENALRQLQKEQN